MFRCNNFNKSEIAYYHAVEDLPLFDSAALFRGSEVKCLLHRPTDKSLGLCFSNCNTMYLRAANARQSVRQYVKCQSLAC